MGDVLENVFLLLTRICNFDLYSSLSFGHCPTVNSLVAKESWVVNIFVYFPL